jgi:uncharacterized protein YneF (UPF0154 family)
MTDIFWILLFILVPILAVLIALFFLAQHIIDKVVEESERIEREKYYE